MKKAKEGLAIRTRVNPIVDYLRSVKGLPHRGMLKHFMTKCSARRAQNLISSLESFCSSL